MLGTLQIYERAWCLLLSHLSVGISRRNGSFHNKVCLPWNRCPFRVFCRLMYGYKNEYASNSHVQSASGCNAIHTWKTTLDPQEHLRKEDHSLERKSVWSLYRQYYFIYSRLYDRESFLWLPHMHNHTSTTKKLTKNLPLLVCALNICNSVFVSCSFRLIHSLTVSTGALGAFKRSSLGASAEFLYL